MASIGDLKGRVVIDNAGSAVLNKLKSDLDGVAAASKRISFANLGQIPTNAIASLRHQIDRLNKSTAAQAGLAAGAGLGFRGLVEQTRNFNESKFGYGVARLTDHMKDGKLDLEAWRKDIDTTAIAVRDKAKSFGAIPDVVMRAREEVEKLGFRGKESESIWDAALGLHLSEPKNLDSGKAAQFLGAVYRAYEGERKKLAAKLGKDANDPAFQEMYIKALAGKALVAGADSALGPANIIEGLRQYAPQWASMGISYDYALAMLAHGSNYGFQAPELGTAYKSMASRLVKPTNAGLDALNRAGINLSDFRGQLQPAAPGKAANQIGAMLPVFTGKGGGAFKAEVRAMLDGAMRDGTTASPEFQNLLSQKIAGRAGPGYEGRIGDIRRAVSSATLSSDGTIDLPGVIKKLVESKVGPAGLMEILEGKHYARNTPTFQHYEKLYALFEKLQTIDGGAMDALVEARRASETGKTDQMLGSWQNLMIALEQSGGVVDRVKDAIIGLNTALAGLPVEALTGLAAGAVALGSIGALAIAAKALPAVAGAAKLGVNLTGIPAGVAGLGALGGWALGRAGVLSSAATVGAPIGLGTAAAGGGAMMGVAAARQFSLLSGARAIALGAGRMLIPGLGIVSLGMMGYGAYQGYRATGTAGGALRGALGIGEAAASPAAPSLSDGMPFSDPSGAMGGTGGEPTGPAAPAAVQSSIDELKAVVGAVDLTAEGERIMATLEAGIRNGTAGVVAAMEAATSSIRNAANTVNLNVGPSMAGSR